MIRVAIGSANVLGLAKIKAKVNPRTAHLLTPGTCVYDCKFCTQARSSSADDKLLSRISWPAFEDERVYEAISKNQFKFKRVCLQVVHSDRSEDFLEYVKEIRSSCDIPLSVDMKAEDMDIIRKTFSKGADCVGLPLDAANPKVYKEIKEGSFSSQFDLIAQAAKEFPAKISTHIMVGLGERESDIVDLILKLNDLNVTIGLFAFTPIKGTALEKRRQPYPAQYRRIQSARYLIINGFELKFKYNEKGAIIGFGHDEKELRNIVRSSAFETSGCPDCNRPYYNEMPKGAMYNYPITLTSSEYENAISEVLKDLEADSG